MKKITKAFLVIIVALGVTFLGSMTAFAGTWKNNSIGWWYQNDDGTYPINQWFKDSDGRWYHFNQDGYMQSGWFLDNNKWYYLGNDGTVYTNTITPDGYYVGTDGAWSSKAIQNYKILGKAVLQINSFIYKDGYYEIKGKLCDTRFSENKLEMLRPLTESEEEMGAQIAFNSIDFLSRLGKNVQNATARNRELGGNSSSFGYQGENGNGDFSWVSISDNGEAYEECVTWDGKFINEVGPAYRYIEDVNFKISADVNFNSNDTSARSIKQFLNYSKEEGCKAYIDFDGGSINSIEVIPWKFG